MPIYNEQVFSIFPLPLYAANIKDEISTAEIDALMNYNEPQKNHLNLISTDKYILQKYPLLKDVIQKHIDNLFYNYLEEDSEEISLRITQSWLNFNRPGDKHHKHYHLNSVISGALYLSCDENSGSFNVYSPRKSLVEGFELLKKKSGTNDFSFDEIKFSPMPFTLYMFPSFLYHDVGINTSAITRLSLAFNTFYKGKLGAYHDATELFL